MAVVASGVLSALIDALKIGEFVAIRELFFLLISHFNLIIFRSIPCKALLRMGWAHLTEQF